MQYVIAGLRRNRGSDHAGKNLCTGERCRPFRRKEEQYTSFLIWESPHWAFGPRLKSYPSCDLFTTYYPFLATMYLREISKGHKQRLRIVECDRRR